MTKVAEITVAKNPRYEWNATSLKRVADLLAAIDSTGTDYVVKLTSTGIGVYR